MLAQILIVAGALIPLVLGTIHFVYTFASTKFDPRDAALGQRMREVSPVISRETSMWNAWVGFNGSHSLGAMLFGAVYAYLGGFHIEVLTTLPVVAALGGLFLAGMLALAVKYWFSIPRNGIALSFVLYVAGCVLAYF